MPDATTAHDEVQWDPSWRKDVLPFRGWRAAFPAPRLNPKATLERVAKRLLPLRGTLANIDLFEPDLLDAGDRDRLQRVFAYLDACDPAAPLDDDVAAAMLPMIGIWGTSVPRTDRSLAAAFLASFAGIHGLGTALTALGRGWQMGFSLSRSNSRAFVPPSIDTGFVDEPWWTVRHLLVHASDGEYAAAKARAFELFGGAEPLLRYVLAFLFPDDRACVEERLAAIAGAASELPGLSPGALLTCVIDAEQTDAPLSVAVQGYPRVTRAYLPTLLYATGRAASRPLLRQLGASEGRAHPHARVIYEALAQIRSPEVDSALASRASIRKEADLVRAYFGAG